MNNNVCKLTCAAVTPSLCISDYAFPYIILVLSLVTLAVYMSASEIQVTTHSALCVFVMCRMIKCMMPEILK